jgi:hypothetical protein
MGVGRRTDSLPVAATWGLGSGGKVTTWELGFGDSDMGGRDDRVGWG